MYRKLTFALRVGCSLADWRDERWPSPPIRWCFTVYAGPGPTPVAPVCTTISECRRCHRQQTPGRYVGFVKSRAKKYICKRRVIINYAHVICNRSILCTCRLLSFSTGYIVFFFFFKTLKYMESHWKKGENKMFFPFLVYEKFMQVFCRTGTPFFSFRYVPFLSVL